MQITPVSPGRGERTVALLHGLFLPPLAGLGFVFFLNPRLSPWAISFRRYAAGRGAASGMSLISDHRPDVTAIANGRPATFGGQKEPKTEPDIIMSGLEIIKSVSNITKSEPDIIKSEADITKSEANITKSEANIIKSEANIIKSEANITKSETNITKSEANITKSEANITKSETNITKSEANIIRKMVKNRHLARKCQKTGHFGSLNWMKRNFCSDQPRRIQNHHISRSCRHIIIALEARQVIAHSLSCGKNGELFSSPGRGERTVAPLGRLFLPPLTGLGFNYFLNPRLSPWAITFRRYAAGILDFEKMTTVSRPARGDAPSTGILKRRKSQRLSCFPASV
jgi:hypothetical protein